MEKGWYLTEKKQYADLLKSAISSDKNHCWFLPQQAIAFNYNGNDGKVGRRVENGM